MIIVYLYAAQTPIRPVKGLYQGYRPLPEVEKKVVETRGIGETPQKSDMDVGTELVPQRREFEVQTEPEVQPAPKTFAELGIQTEEEAQNVQRQVIDVIPNIRPSIIAQWKVLVTELYTTTKRKIVDFKRDEDRNKTYEKAGWLNRVKFDAKVIEANRIVDHANQEIIRKLDFLSNNFGQLIPVILGSSPIFNDQGGQITLNPHALTRALNKEIQAQYVGNLIKDMARILVEIRELEMTYYAEGKISKQSPLWARNWVKNIAPPDLTRERILRIIKPPVSDFEKSMDLGINGKIRLALENILPMLFSETALEFATAAVNKASVATRRAYIEGMRASTPEAIRYKGLPETYEGVPGTIYQESRFMPATVYQETEAGMARSGASTPSRRLSSDQGISSEGRSSGLTTPQLHSGNVTPQLRSGSITPQFESGSVTPQSASGWATPQRRSGNTTPQPGSGSSSGRSTPESIPELNIGVTPPSYRSQVVQPQTFNSRVVWQKPRT